MVKARYLADDTVFSGLPEFCATSHFWEAT